MTRGFVVLVGVAGLAAVGLAEGTTPGPDTGVGRVLFGTYCASCHGLAGDGTGPVAAALRTPPPDLTRLTERYGTPLPREILAAFVDGREDVIAHGPREMPVWGIRFFWSDTDANVEARLRRTIGAIVDYLEAIQRVRDTRRRPGASGPG